MDKFLKKFNFINNLTSEAKTFYIFLVVHLIVWSSVALIRASLPADSLEGIWWGMLHDFGSPKHPPLAAWLTYAVFMPFKSDFCVYFLSQLSIIGGFIYTYKLAQNFLDNNKAMLSVILLEGAWIYTYVTCFYGFNPDVVLLFTLPAITYYFYNCIKKNSKSDWIKLGVLVGLSLLAKYQTGLLIIAMAIYALIFNRKIFKSKYFYLSIFIAFLIFLPHLIWLFKTNFCIFLYYNEELNSLTERNSILIFLLMQLFMILGTLVIYTHFRLTEKLPLKFIENYDKKDAWFLILLTFIPLIIHIYMGLTNKSGIIPRWNYVFWYQIGIILFYFFPCEIKKEQFNFVLRLAYGAMIITFLILGTLFAVEKNYRSRYPAKVVFNDFKTIWEKQYSTPLKYIGGDTEWAYPLVIYPNDKLIYIMDTYSYKNLWIDANDLKKSGALIVERDYNKVITLTKSSCPYLPKDYKIKPSEYNFVIKNALGQKRAYTIYYVIVPPQIY